MADPSVKMDYPKLVFASLCLITVFQLSHTLSPDQPLSDGEVLISPDQTFKLGFFSPGKSTNRYLGIWYTATPDVVIWLANRNNPILDSTGALTLHPNGTLVLSSVQRAKIWSSDSSRPASSPVVKLLDTRNLVLVYDSTYIWESFNYPTDYSYPGIGAAESTNMTSWRSADDPSSGEYSCRIENKGLSQLIIYTNGMKKFMRIVFWNGILFGIPDKSDPDWKYEVVSNRGRMISAFRPLNGKIKFRELMNYTGQLERYVMNEQKDGWNLTLLLPRDKCDSYGHCGHNSICRIYKLPICECLRGFKPKSEKEWRMFNWESGCSRSLPSSDCQKNYGFLKVNRIRLPDSLNFRLNTSMAIDECSDDCLKNCECTAYADPHFSNGSSCLMWFGDLIDIREHIEEAGDGPSLYLRMPVSELDNLTDLKKREGSAKTAIIITAAAISFGMFILGSSFGGLFIKMQHKKQDSKKMREELDIPLFGWQTIAAATNNFSGENLIGEGGFGPVYKANLSSSEVVAVKRMSRTSGQGPQEFRNEVILIAKLQHRNLIRILGCCIEREEKMLIYDYMHNKSLDFITFVADQERKVLLTWPKRLNIIMGIAKGLHYLHHDSILKVIHRDLKTSNILLDENLNAKISDFGLARMLEGDQTTARTRRIVGTYGYMAPEYALEGKFSINSDVYSLGVIILEIVSGIKNTGFQHPSCYNSLMEQAWLLWNKERELELMDPCYNSSQVESQVRRCIQVGLLCVQNKANERPPMSSVLLMLSTDDTVLPQPQKPGFFMQTSNEVLRGNALGRKKSSRVSISISDELAR